MTLLLILSLDYHTFNILLETVPLDMGQHKSKNGASVSEELALIQLKFRMIYPVNGLFKVNISNI